MTFSAETFPKIFSGELSYATVGKLARQPVARRFGISGLVLRDPKRVAVDKRRRARITDTTQFHLIIAGREDPSGNSHRHDVVSIARFRLQRFLRVQRLVLAEQLCPVLLKV